jgi:hypothetical protein
MNIKNWVTGSPITNHEGQHLISAENRIVKVMESTSYAKPDEYVCSRYFQQIPGLTYFDDRGIEKVIVVSFRTNLLRTQWKSAMRTGLL